MVGSSLARRAAVGLTTSATKKNMPMSPELIDALVDQRGLYASLKFSFDDLSSYRRTMKAWGPVKTHFLAAALSIVDDNEFCAYGHTLAFQLHYFQLSGNLFFIDEQRMLAAAANGRTKAIETLTIALNESGLQDQVRVLERLFHVLDEGPDSSEEDQHLQSLVDALAFLKVGDIDPDYRPSMAHDPVNDDAQLKATYEKAREHFL